MRSVAAFLLAQKIWYETRQNASEEQKAAIKAGVTVLLSDDSFTQESERIDKDYTATVTVVSVRVTGR